jgi:pSer/pThr/pTyr-binding forkhead associated (FHA) protein
MSTARPSNPSAVPVLQVHTPDGRVFRFSTAFHIGRDHDCGVRLTDVHVSRKHVVVSIENGCWCVRDLKSANGIFVAGRRVDSATVDGSVAITLGADGPSLTFELEGVAAGRRRSPLPQTIQQAGDDSRLIASYEERYFGSKTGEGRGGGPRTMMIRRAFENVQ